VTDLELVKAGAVAALRSALTSGREMSAAIRRCWYRNPVFSSTLFPEAMRRRFGEGCDIREITQFAARIHKERSAEHESFPAREAEALIRAVLGEVRFFEDVHPGCFSYSEIGITVLGSLFQDWFPDASEARSFLRGVEEVAAAARGRPRELAVLESDWFAAGMHDSPFCVWESSGPEFRLTMEGRNRLA
jgi:hypothetical protein